MDANTTEIPFVPKIERNQKDVALYTQMQTFSQAIESESGLRLIPFQRPSSGDISDDPEFEMYAVDGSVAFVLQDSESKIGRIVSLYRGNDELLKRKYAQTGLQMDEIGENDLVIVQIQGPAGEWSEPRIEEGKVIDAEIFRTFRWEKSLILLSEAFAATHGYSNIHILPAEAILDLWNIDETIRSDTRTLAESQSEMIAGKPRSFYEERVISNTEENAKLRKRLHMRYDVTAKRMGYRQKTEHGPYSLDITHPDYNLSLDELTSLSDSEKPTVSLREFIDAAKD